MNDKKTFKKYYGRLATEGLLKALLFGLAIACAVYCILVLVMWFTEISWMIWVAVAAFAAVLACSVCALYFTKFRPAAKAIAARVDRLGLEERLVTMVELEQDSSFMALRQREDALESMDRVSPKNVKIVVPALGLTLCVLLLLCGASMTVLTALAEQDIIDNPVHEIVDPTPPDVYYTISYKVIGYTADDEELEGMGGMIEGLEDQLVLDGGAAEQVVAVADEEWAFLTWSDGSTDPTRLDILDLDALLADNESGTVTTTEDGEIVITYYAYFMELEPSEGDAPSDQETDPDAPMDEPQEPSEDGGGSGNEGDGAGGKYEEENQIIAGDTYYREKLEEYLQQAQDIIAAGGEVPDYLIEIIESYYGSIQ